MPCIPRHCLAHTPCHLPLQERHFYSVPTQLSGWCCCDCACYPYKGSPCHCLYMVTMNSGTTMSTYMHYYVNMAENSAGMRYTSVLITASPCFVHAHAICHTCHHHRHSASTCFHADFASHQESGQRMGRLQICLLHMGSPTPAACSREKISASK